MSPALPAPLVGVVLAGGLSSRMGAEKAGIVWEGTTLLARAATTLAEVCGAVVVVRSAGRQLPPLPAGVRVVDDAHPGRGPLEGLAAGLRAVPPEAVAFVSAVDMPLLDARFAAGVLAALTTEADAAVPRVGGRPQPLAAAYRAGVALRAIDDLLGSGGRSMGALLDRLSVRWLDDLPGAERAVRNVNTPAELEGARQANREKATTDPAPPSWSSPTQASAVAPAREVTA